jgi:hypothetical protein
MIDMKIFIKWYFFVLIYTKGVYNIIKEWRKWA